MSKKIVDILYAAQRSGVHVVLNGTGLQVKVPREKKIDDRLLQDIKENKALIIDFLKTREKEPASTSIIQIERPDRLPLSFGQERLWLIDKLEGTIAYHIPTVLRFRGSLNRQGIEYALQQIVNRHEVLRTVIHEDNGIPYQYIKSSSDWKMDTIEGGDLFLDPQKLSAKVDSLVYSPFDLSKDYMFKAHLIRLKTDDHVLVIVLHHIASDGWSMPIVFEELVELYKGYDGQRSSPLKKLQVQYGDYALWQRKYLTEEILSLQLDYWKIKLQGVTPLNLPTDYTRSMIQGYRGGMLHSVIEQPLWDKLRELSRVNGVTLFMTLLGAFKVLLHRYSGQDNICVGSPIAGRQQAEVEGLIGFFVNTLALRSSLEGNPPFLKFLEQVRDTTLSAYDHQSVPFERVVDTVVKDQDMSRSALFQVMFTLQNTTGSGALENALPGVFVQEEFLVHRTSKFDLTYSVTEVTGHLQLSVEYNTDLYGPGTIERMISHYHNLLQAIVRDPSTRIGNLELLGKEESDTLLTRFNDTVANYPFEKTVVDLISHQVEKTPDHIAVACGAEEISYRVLEERSNQLGHYLRSRGVREETLVPICVERSINMVIGILGIMKAGGAYVPIDPEYPQGRIAYMLDDTAASLVLTSSELHTKINFGTNIAVLDIDKDTDLLAYSIKPLQTRLHAKNLAYILYTSGSTGKPKGVMIEHFSLINFLLGMLEYFDLATTSSLLSVTTYTFDIFNLELYLPLLCGGKTLIVDQETTRDGMRLKDEIARTAPTHMQGTPSTWQMLVDSGWRNQENVIMLVGGEALHEKLKEELTMRGEVWNLYGPTETTIWSTIKRLQQGERVLIGKPISNTSIYIVDKSGNLSPIGVPGDMLIGGYGLARGYFGQTHLTVKNFVENPIRNGHHQRVYRTGDLARWLPNGNLDFLGRSDSQIKIRGYRVELGEIENVLLQSDFIAEACIVDKTDGSGNKRIVGYYVPDLKELKRHEQSAYEKQLENWKEIYEQEDKKKEEMPDIDAEFNINLWKDSFSGNAIPPEEMKEWLDETVNVILAEGPKHVLEINCGTGLIYYRLIEQIETYTGTDISATSIRQLRRRVSESENLIKKTELHVCAAHEITWQADHPIDTIILNSVIQYFPGEKYLVDVLQKSISLLQGHGIVMIGDVRDNRLLHAFKSRIQLGRLKASTRLSDFKWSVDQEVLKEEELCFSPEYFYNLSTQFPEIEHVDIQWKKGDYVNELTLYRYNVILYVGIHKEITNPEWITWKTGVDKQSLYDKIAGGVDVIALKDVYNPRLFRERSLYASLKDHSVDTLLTLSKQLLHKDPEGTEISALVTMAKSKGYQFRYFMHEDPFRMNLVLSLPAAHGPIKSPFNRSAFIKTELTNIPLFAEICWSLRKDIRTFLSRQLPDYMIPQELIPLRNLPLTSNGKIDRKFLREQEHLSTSSQNHYETPANDLEIQMAQLWSDLISLSRIGVNDNFFEIGGNSLLATRIVSAIRKVLKIELSIKDLFNHPTIRKLSVYIRSAEKASLLPPIEKAVRPDHLPLSYGQERLWFIDKLEGSTAYHIPSVLRLRGPLNIVGMVRAFQEIVNRHEVLRTVIQDNGGIPYQVVKSDSDWKMDIIEGGDLCHDQQKLSVRVKSLVYFPFDLSKDYMLRVHLIRLQDNDHVLVVVFHHIAADGWSMPIVFEELVELYNGYDDQSFPSLKDLNVQYGDYALWQRKYLTEKVLFSQLAYWQDKLQDVSPLNLPTDYGRGLLQGSRGGMLHLVIEKPLRDQLQKLSTAHGVTLFMTMLGVFKVLLNRYSGQEDICVGSPIAGRQQAEVEGLVGFFVNTLALRSDLRGNPSFSNLLAQLRETTLSAYDHQSVPFERVVDAVVKERDMSRSALFQVMFILQNIPKADGIVNALPGISVQEEYFDQIASKFDLTYSITEAADSLHLSVEYSADLYQAETIMRMMNHYHNLLQGIVMNPSARIGDLELLSKDESDKLLTVFNATSKDYPLAKTVLDLISDQVQRTPDSIAVVSSREQISYRVLEERSNQLGHYLRSRGVREETLVPICIERGVDMVIGILGILKAGGAYVPIDPDYPQERITYMLEDTAATIIITSQDLAAGLSFIGTENILILDNDWQKIEQCARHELNLVLNAHQLAYVIYTSGSTGRPKGVMIEHQSLANYLTNSKTKYINPQSANSGTFVHLPFTFDASVTALFMPLVYGKSIIMGSKKSVEIFKDDLFRQYAPYDFIKLTPAHLPLLESAMTENGKVKLADRIILGGEPLYWRNIKFIADQKVEIINEYGPTEATVGCTTFSFFANDVGWESNETKIPIGKPIDNTRIYILDALHNLCPIGVYGDLWIGGEGISRGYLKRPELTSELFKGNPFLKAAEQRIYKTGDKARWLAGGALEYAGRSDDQLKFRGYRIEPGEIEQTISQSKMIRQVVVVMKKDRNNTDHLIAYVVPSDMFKRENVISFLRMRLPMFMIPIVVEQPHLPLTAHGKINKQALPDYFDTTLTLAEKFISPRNQTEKKIVDIWSDVLSLQPATMGIDNNFFDIGGNSLLMVRVQFLLNQTFEKNISITTLFMFSTIRGLAESINASGNTKDEDFNENIKESLYTMHDTLSLKPINYDEEQ